MIESKQTYLIDIPFEYYNEDCYLKPQGYQKITNIIGEVHLKNTDQKIGSFILGKYSWVILSLTIEVNKPINELKPVYGKTWYSGRRGPFFRREYQVEDEKGNIIFVGASYSILMDMEKRTIFRQQQLPFAIFKETNKHLLEAKVSLKEDRAEIKLLEDKIQNSYIDGLGHVNNLRYSEFIYNSFNQVQLNKIKKPFKFELYFQKEMVNQEYYAVYSNEIDFYQIYNINKNEIAFSFIIKGE